MLAARHASSQTPLVMLDAGGELPPPGGDIGCQALPWAELCLPQLLSAVGKGKTPGVTAGSVGLPFTGEPLGRDFPFEIKRCFLLCEGYSCLKMSLCCCSLGQGLGLFTHGPVSRRQPRRIQLCPCVAFHVMHTGPQPAAGKSLAEAQ